MTQRQWSQEELERIFVRKDLNHREHNEFEKDIAKLERTMEWWTRLIITQGVLLVVGLIMFIVERFSP